MSTNVITVNSNDTETLNRLYNGSALTLEGLNADDIDSLLDYVDEVAGLKNRTAYKISGATMNNAYKLTDDNAYPDNLTIVCVALEDIKDVDSIVMARFDFGGRWFDDVVDNNARREEENGNEGIRKL